MLSVRKMTRREHEKDGEVDLPARRACLRLSSSFFRASSASRASLLRFFSSFFLSSSLSAAEDLRFRPLELAPSPVFA